MWKDLSVKVLRQVASKYKSLHSLGNVSKQPKSVLIETLKNVMEWRGMKLFTKAEHGNKMVVEIEKDEPTPKAKEPTPKAKKPTPKAKEPTPKAKEPTPKAKEPTPKAKTTLLSIYDNAVNYITKEIFGKNDLGDIGRLVFNLDDGLMKASYLRLRFTDKADRLFEELEKMSDQQKAKLKKGIEKILTKITTDKSFDKRGVLDQFLRTPKLFTLEKVLEAEGFGFDGVYKLDEEIVQDNDLRKNFTSRSRTGLKKLLNEITSLLETIFLNQ